MPATTARKTPTDLLRVSDLSAGQLGYLLDLAGEMKKDRRTWSDALRGETVTLLFEKPSTRTRVSFAAAVQRLGGMPVALRPDELQLGRGEPIADTARVLSSYSAAIAVRKFAQATLEEMAEAAAVPVINALSDEHHPCQALADLLTLRERFGTLEGLVLAYVGDGNNVARSLIEAGVLAGIVVRLSCPPGYTPPVWGAMVVHDPRDAVRGADAVYTDLWVSMGEEADRARRLADLAAYQVNADMMDLAAPHAVFLHCLPAHRGEEVTGEVIDGSASVVWQQAANRLPTEQALLYALISGDWGA